MRLTGSWIKLGTGCGQLEWEGVHAVRWLQEVAGEHG